MVPDGISVIGTVPKVTKVAVATSHAGLWVTLGPLTGELTEDLIEGENLPGFAPAFLRGGSEMSPRPGGRAADMAGVASLHTMGGG
jgi:glycine/D-amino acid oxidase-like deaminating enzyme